MPRKAKPTLILPPEYQAMINHAVRRKEGTREEITKQVFEHWHLQTQHDILEARVKQLERRKKIQMMKQAVKRYRENQSAGHSQE